LVVDRKGGKGKNNIEQKYKEKLSLAVLVDNMQIQKN